MSNLPLPSELPSTSTFSTEYSQNFYLDLLNEATEQIKRLNSPVMVCGPLHHGDNFEENFKVFRNYQHHLSAQDHQVFDQLSYLDRNLAGAPFNFDIKFEVFYKGIIATKLINTFFFIPGWDESRGARTEKEYCDELGLVTIELDPFHS